MTIARSDPGLRGRDAKGIEPGKGNDLKIGRRLESRCVLV